MTFVLTHYLRLVVIRLLRWLRGEEWVNLGQWKREIGVTVDGYPYGEKYRSCGDEASCGDET